MADRAGTHASHTGRAAGRWWPALLVVVAMLTLSATTGCITLDLSGGNGGDKGGGGSTKAEKPSRPKLTTDEAISAAAGALGDKMDETRLIGSEGGPSGFEAVRVIDGVQASMTAARSDIASAQAYFAATPDAEGATALLGRLTALGQAINECEESLTLTRIAAVAENAMIQATAGGESAGNAVSKANDEDYDGAVASARDAKDKLAKARVQFAQLAKEYPGANFQNDVAYCEAAVKFADVALDLTRTGRDKDWTEYNKLVKTANARRESLLKRTDPTSRWAKIVDDSVREYNQAVEVLGKVEDGGSP